MNPFKTDKFKEQFTLTQAQDVMNNLNSVHTLRGAIKSEITFGSNSDVEKQMLNAGFIPTFILNNKQKSLKEGTIHEYGFPVIENLTGFLLDDQGNYLYDSYTEDEKFFDPILEPLLLVIDHERNAFMFQYLYGICVFGDNTGSLTYVKMD